MSGLPVTGGNPTGAVTGRFAFQYLVTHADPQAPDGYGNDIGIDNFAANLPEPSPAALLFFGAMGAIPVRIAVGRRLRRNR
jgi:hypothetical protein